ncbi:PaaI family thioesterase, partial [Providencia stuartii]|uniref:PaaI family thioesterase n=1 Tax=Providencia stuartii TaxID=588 RepID=UPI0034DF9C57
MLRRLTGEAQAHGGLLATLSDVAAAYTLAPLLPADARVVTTSLRIDYVAAVRAGDFLE